MIKKVFYKLRWADNNRIETLFKVLYMNTVKINRFAIFEWDLRKDFDAIQTIPKEYEIKIIDYKELQRYLPRDKYLPREFYMNAIAGLKHCVVAIKDNEIVHIDWIYMAGEKNRFFDIKSDEAHINYGFTFPEHRRRGLNIQKHFEAARWLKEKNMKRILYAVHEDTIYMRRGLEKIRNIRRVGTLTHWFIYRPKFRG
jgi:hypothetical protein